MARDPQMFWEGEPNRERCSHCGKVSDRLAVLMERQRRDISQALGLSRSATHEEVMDFLRRASIAYTVPDGA